MATDILGKVGQFVGQKTKAINNDIVTNYATKVSLATVENSLNNLDLTPYSTKVSLASAEANTASNLSAITDLQNTRATVASISDILDGTTEATHLKADEATFAKLKVTGETTVVDTQTVQVSDNIIELNLAEGGGETAQSSGLDINRGSGQDKASFLWQNATNLFETKIGSSLANLNSSTITAEIFSAPSGSAIKVNNVELGDYASFETAYNLAIV